LRLHNDALLQLIPVPRELVAVKYFHVPSMHENSLPNTQILFQQRHKSAPLSFF
jgi:hypothetical protein